MKYTCFLLSILPFITYSQEIGVFSEKTDTTINFFVRNPHYCHYTVHIQFEVFENMTSSIPWPATLVVEPLAERHFLLSVKQQPTARSWKYKVQYRFDRGNLIGTKHNDRYEYLLPYKSNRAHKLMQGYFGKFSHAETHALDFEMPEGTEVVAAREGVVIETKEDSNTGGLTRDFIDKGNFVLIYHSDGTFASYYHLKRNGALVKEGQQVKRGEVIGLSGNTGWSSAPHLHFEVLLPSSGSKQTVPTRFLQKDGMVAELKEGNSY
jgi:murein DD-endopeptidase MepM/ murein hydrolase activator NlpD